MSKDKIAPERRQRLEDLPGWSWDAHSDQWKEGFAHLKQFADREGHCRVAQNYKTGDAYRLGQWVRVQRSSKDTIDTDRRRRLEALLGWSWDPFSDRWEEGFAYLEQFLEREGHCRVRSGYETNDGFRLGQWVAVQRRNMDSMEPNRRQRLDSLAGWVWRAKK